VDEDLRSSIDRIRSALAGVIRGKPEVIELLLVGVLGSGHVLVEDVPGVGKTTLAKALARVFDVGFARVQFTPDLLPADILGTEILNPADGTFSFHAGPIFTNVLLADEINRASPRTQSALLEAMNERQVTIEGKSHALPQPFMVIATQNPIDFHGTYPLPEAQLDRFLLRLTMGYPETEDELRILVDRKLDDPLLKLVAVADDQHVRRLCEAARRVEVKEPVARYLLEIVAATRGHPDLGLGISPRGALALYRAGQARALLSERDHVTPADLQALAVATLAHRVMPTQQARYGGTRTEAVIARILEQIPVPV
jgi:MoxR-like ATPase